MDKLAINSLGQLDIIVIPQMGYCKDYLFRRFEIFDSVVLIYRAGQLTAARSISYHWLLSREQWLTAAG